MFKKAKKLIDDPVVLEVLLSKNIDSCAKTSLFQSNIMSIFS